MAQCEACGSANRDDVLICGLCSHKLGTPPKTYTVPQLGPYTEERANEDVWNSLAEKQESERRWESRFQGKKKTHGIVAAIIFFVVQIALGIPRSLYPLNFLIIAIFSVVVGYPVGYFVSSYGGNKATGALTSGVACALLNLILSIPMLLHGGEFGIALSLVAIGNSFVVGLLPGYLIGYHIQLDE